MTEDHTRAQISTGSNVYLLDHSDKQHLANVLEAVQPIVEKLFQNYHASFKKGQHTAFQADITHLMDVFPRLGLAPGYRLVAYMANEYHGPYGHVTAIQSDGDLPQGELDSSYPLPKLKLPEQAIDPIEAIYCDGTAEGYFDVILFSHLLWCIPRRQHIYCPNEKLLLSRPELQPENWDIWLDPREWTPKVELHKYGARVLLYIYTYEHGWEASDGLDHIHLKEYHFNGAFGWLGKKGKVYPASKFLVEQFPKNGKPCYFGCSDIQLAKEKTPAETL